PRHRKGMMARKCSPERGYGLAKAPAGGSRPVNARPLTFKQHSSNSCVLGCAALVLLLCLAALPASAQGGASPPDIHLSPREIKTPQADLAPGGGDDPTLKTHTKPIVTDVDLVLVPITVTDPMNRL